tara:strand:+ start:4901 stop:5764 length:864 start_codon:yes stop_codon:yes gene_type:complete
MKKNYIILPMYNDWVSLRKVLDILNRSFKNTKDYNHIIIVNDCSDNKFQRKKYINFKSITILNLRKNVGSQKAIFFGLKYLQKVLKNNSSKATVSVLDSDGEDNPVMVKRLIKTANEKKDYFIFASRKQRTEGIFFKIFNQFRLIITYALTGRYINFGNFSAFSSKLLNKLLANNELCLAYSSGVLKNYNKFSFLKIKKNKRFYGKSKVNLKFLLTHTLNIISVFYKTIFIRSTILFLLLSLIYDQFFFRLIFFILFFSINLIFIFTYHFGKSNKLNLSLIKKIEII